MDLCLLLNANLEADQTHSSGRADAQWVEEESRIHVRIHCCIKLIPGAVVTYLLTRMLSSSPVLYTFLRLYNYIIIYESVNNSLGYIVHILLYLFYR